ncbi:MAG: 16S rRNA processing protein RimM [Actinobacteria bacterium]|nr:16S rRNA processing protein RimM [Actinomycetota bacterium]
MSAPAHLEVGRIGRAHGLHGEVSVTLTTNREERVAPGATLHAADRDLVVASSRRHQRRWLVRFEGVDDRDAAEALRGEVLTAEPLPSEEGELWVHELVGATVADRSGTTLGTVVAVEANPASDLLVLAPVGGGSDLLVPMAFVVHHGHGRVVVDVPEGLFDLNS